MTIILTRLTGRFLLGLETDYHRETKGESNKIAF
jgi:hypothetical protein